MTARADAAARTRQRILGSTVELAREKLTVEITLDEVAARAGVTVQTVIRQFSNREGLLDAAVEWGHALVLEERRPATNDIDEAMRVLVDHYELRGDFMVRMVAQESDARIRAFVEAGKDLHRNWVSDVFAQDLGAASDSESLTDQLVVSTDLHTWKLLRRDRDLDRTTVESRMRSLVEAVLANAHRSNGNTDTDTDRNRS
jgi:AcrR family transcriptional regulator